MNNDMASILAIQAFENDLIHKRRVNNSDLMFQANISFKAGSNTIQEENVTVRVTHSGTEHGHIKVVDSEIINDKDLHTEFRPGNQNYQYSTPYLIVSGNSPKLGSYTVQFEENS